MYSISVCYVSRCNIWELYSFFSTPPQGLGHKDSTVPCNFLEGKYPNVVFSQGCTSVVGT